MYDSIFEVAKENAEKQYSNSVQNLDSDKGNNTYRFDSVDDLFSNRDIIFSVTNESDKTTTEMRVLRSQINFYENAEESFSDTMNNFNETVDDLGKAADGLEDFDPIKPGAAGGGAGNTDALNLMALDTLGDKGKDLVSSVLGSFDDVAQEVENQTGKSRREARADLVKLNAELPKQIVSDVGETSEIAKQLVDSGYAATLVETLTDSVKYGLDEFTEKQKELIEDKFSDVIKDGKVQLSTHSLLQMAKNQAVLKNEDIGTFIDQVQADNLDKDTLAQYFATLSENKGKTWYKPEDVSKFTTDLMNEQMTFIAQKYSNDEVGRKKAVKKLMLESVKAQFGTSSAFGNSDDVASEINSFTGATEQEKMELSKKYLAVGIDARQIDTLIQNQDIEKASRLIGLARAKAADIIKSNDTGKIANLSTMGWSVNDIKSDKNFQKVKNAREYLDSYNEASKDIKLGSVGDLLENETSVSHTWTDKVKAYATRNPVITEIASFMGDTGVDLSDVGWGAYLSKRAFDLSKGAVTKLGTAVGLGGAGAAGAAGAGATGVGAGAAGAGAAAGGKLALGTVAKTVGKILGPVIAVGETLYDGYSGYKSADEWEVGKTNATLSSAVAGTSDGYWGAGTNALKWGAIGATVGSVVPVVGTALGGAIGAAGGAITGYFGGEKFSKTISSGLDTLSDSVSNGIDWVTEFSSDVWDITTESFRNLKSDVYSYSTKKIDDAKNYVTGLYDDVSNSFLGIKDTVFGYISGVKSKVVDSVNGVFDSFYSIFDTIKSKIDKFKSYIPGFSSDDSGKKWYEFWKKDNTLGDSVGDGLKQTVINKVLESEGGYSNHKNDRGGETMYGITKDKARSLGYTGDMKSMPKEIATKYYSDLYDKVQSKYNLSPESSAVAFDLAVNSGEGRVKDMLSKTGDNAGAMYEWRKDYYDRIVDKNPSQKVFQKGWHNRIDNLKTALAKAIPSDFSSLATSGVESIRKTEQVINNITNNNTDSGSPVISLDMSKLESIMQQNNILMQALLGVQVKNSKSKIDPTKNF